MGAESVRVLVVGKEMDSGMEHLQSFLAVAPFGVVRGVAGRATGQVSRATPDWGLEFGRWPLLAPSDAV